MANWFEVRDAVRVVVAVVCCLLSAVLGAAELDVAREALRDGLWDVARTHAAGVTNAEAKLIVLESLAGEGKWKSVAEQLDAWKDEKGPAFDYYRAVVRGDHKMAMALLKAGGSDEGVVEARLHEAETLQGAGKEDAAREIWREVAAGTNLSDRALALVGANLKDPDLLKRAYETVRFVSLRRMVGLRLGVVWLRDPAQADKGERLIRAIIKDAPDSQDAKEAFLAIADAKVAAGRWNEAVDAYHEAFEIWPDVVKNAAVQENCGWALQKLGRREEALEAFRTAGSLAKDEDSHALALLKEGDLLSEMGRTDESMAKYREVMEKHPKTTVAEKLKTMIRLRELEAEGRRLYAEVKFEEARKVFAQVGEEDSSRRQRMRFFEALCRYGQGRDDMAERDVRELVETSPDPLVRADATLWLAKHLYNRRDWQESERLFSSYAELPVSSDSAAEALLWASRAALAQNDFDRAIRLSTRLLGRYPDSPSKPAALLVQGEALVEQARFDEAVLLFERVTLADAASERDRVRAQALKADALYVMGADNPARYEAALEAYQSFLRNESLTGDERLVISFKVARALEKLKRTDEAVDQYYSQVVLAYRTGRLRGERFSDEARAAFSRAAFWLADEYESRGRDRQALSVLELVVESDVPAAEEARRRCGRILGKGGFL